MSQGTDLTPLTTTQVERMISAVEQISAAIEHLGDRIIPVLGQAPASD